tara:strand:- start:22316 stop:22600 length:285 start_codon:yes stop_codon:yes gene_type:complete
MEDTDFDFNVTQFLNTQLKVIRRVHKKIKSAQVADACSKEKPRKHIREVHNSVVDLKVIVQDLAAGIELDLEVDLYANHLEKEVKNFKERYDLL